MSTVAASNFSDKTTTVSAEYVVHGSAKVFANIDGLTASGTLRDSLNVSSFTDVTTGNYNLAFATAFSAADYVPSVTAEDTGNGNGNGVHSSVKPSTMLSSSITLNQYSWAGSWHDVNMFAHAFGDLA